MPEVLVVKSQEELDQAIQTSRADASIKQIEIRAKKTVETVQERPLQMKVELHDLARVEGAPPSLAVTRKVGLAELDLAGLGMAQLAAGLGHEQSLER